jgi:hypothetical protein
VTEDLKPRIPFDLGLGIQAKRAFFGEEHEDEFKLAFIIQDELRSSELGGMDFEEGNHLFNPGFARACFYGACACILV